MEIAVLVWVMTWTIVCVAAMLVVPILLLTFIVLILKSLIRVMLKLPRKR